MSTSALKTSLMDDDGGTVFSGKSVATGFTEVANEFKKEWPDSVSDRIHNDEATEYLRLGARESSPHSFSELEVKKEIEKREDYFPVNSTHMKCIWPFCNQLATDLKVFGYTGLPLACSEACLKSVLESIPDYYQLMRVLPGNHLVELNYYLAMSLESKVKLGNCIKPGCNFEADAAPGERFRSDLVPDELLREPWRVHCCSEEHWSDCHAHPVARDVLRRAERNWKEALLPPMTAKVESPNVVNVEQSGGGGAMGHI